MPNFLDFAFPFFCPRCAHFLIVPIHPTPFVRSCAVYPRRFLEGAELKDAALARRELTDRVDAVQTALFRTAFSSQYHTLVHFHRGWGRQKWNIFLCRVVNKGDERRRVKIIILADFWLGFLIIYIWLIFMSKKDFFRFL